MKKLNGLCFSVHCILMKNKYHIISYLHAIFLTGIKDISWKEHHLGKSVEFWIICFSESHADSAIRQVHDATSLETKQFVWSLSDRLQQWFVATVDTLQHNSPNHSLIPLLDLKPLYLARSTAQWNMKRTSPLWTPVHVRTFPTRFRIISLIMFFVSPFPSKWLLFPSAFRSFFPAHTCSQHIYLWECMRSVGIMFPRSVRNTDYSHVDIFRWRSVLFSTRRCMNIF